MQSDNPAVKAAGDALMAAELESLNSPLGLLRDFPGELEQSFRVWLDTRMQSLLRQYLWALMILFSFLIMITGINIYWFTPVMFREGDLDIYMAKSLALGCAMVMLLWATRQPVSGQRFRYAIGLVCILLLVMLGVAVPAYGGSYNRIMGMTNLWVAAIVIFATGLHLPRACLVIMLCVLPCIVMFSLMQGLTENLWLYCVQLCAAGMFLLVFSFVMARVHRQVFLQEGILMRDKTRLTELTEQLSQLSLRDALTGVANRRRFDEVLEREWGRARRQQSPLALLFIDVDNFKAYNDYYGHQAGDDCLRAVAFVLVDSGRRQADLVARYGGEEFVLLLPDTDMAGAMDAAQRIRAFLGQTALPHVAVPQGRVTVSIGVATHVPDNASDAASLVAAADQAVYRAKKEGRDRVVAANGGA